MRRHLLFAALLALAPAVAVAQRPSHLVADSGRFVLDGRPLQIISGEMHYARIPRAYWHDRLRKARAMGLNTISTYVFWNWHEATPNHYDFSGERDVAAFVRAARDEGLHVILRPGPYVCAEWELGGYPGWLLADSAIVLRSTDPRFTQPAERWLMRLGHELTPLLASRGGPIIAVQVENEYGSFDRDPAYMAWQRDALTKAGFRDVLRYTADGDVQLPRGTLQGLPAVVNFGTGEADSAFARLARVRPNGPLMSGEYWAGWFDQWGRSHARTDATRQTRELEWMLGRGYSVNLYMFHGGTTPGFMNGANIDGGRYFPQTSSYDYDAALDESGRPTAKWYAFRDVIARRTGVTPPPFPTIDSTIAIAPFALTRATTLWSALPKATHVERPRAMETFGQSTGYILYRTRVQTPATGTLVVRDVRDYVQVYVDGALVGTLDRRLAQESLTVSVVAGARLDLLVENSGRVNFAKPLREERKGIAHGVTLAGRELTGWDVYPLPIASTPSLGAVARDTTAAPAFWRGAFTLDRAGDTFLDTRGWGKGTVWINGHHLGRFWDIGPQQTLYVPAPWLRAGRNDVVVFALGAPAEPMLRTQRAPVYGANR